jgi:p-aminobenzoyl-glutamate transporter AbgT
MDSSYPEVVKYSLCIDNIKTVVWYIGKLLYVQKYFFSVAMAHEGYYISPCICKILLQLTTLPPGHFDPCDQVNMPVMYYFLSLSTFLQVNLVIFLLDRFIDEKCW